VCTEHVLSSIGVNDGEKKCAFNSIMVSQKVKFKQWV